MILNTVPLLSPPIYYYTPQNRLISKHIVSELGTDPFRNTYFNTLRYKNHGCVRPVVKMLFPCI